MNELIYAFGQLLFFLSENKTFDRSQWDEVNPLVDRLLGEYPLIDAAELEELVPKNDRVRATTHDRRRYLYLQPVQLRHNRPLLPLFSFDYDFSTYVEEDDADLTVASAQYALGLFTTSIEADSDIVSVGFRIETPHGSDGIHDYCHAQFIQHFDQRDGDLPVDGVPNWLPVRAPTLPLDARDPITLLMAVMISLYGREVMMDLNQSTKGLLKSTVDSLHVIPAGF